MDMAQQQQNDIAELESAARAALTNRKGTHAKDPGPGYWDGRMDFRTGSLPSQGRTFVVSDNEGCGWARRRAVPTGSCPSGPCGSRSEIATWYEPAAPLKIAGLPTGSIRSLFIRPDGVVEGETPCEREARLNGEHLAIVEERHIRANGTWDDFALGLIR